MEPDKALRREIYKSKGFIEARIILTHNDLIVKTTNMVPPTYRLCTLSIELMDRYRFGPQESLSFFVNKRLLSDLSMNFKELNQSYKGADGVLEINAVTLERL